MRLRFVRQRPDPARLHLREARAAAPVPPSPTPLSAPPSAPRRSRSARLSPPPTEPYPRACPQRAAGSYVTKWAARLGLRHLPRHNGGGMDRRLRLACTLVCALAGLAPAARASAQVAAADTSSAPVRVYL